jgi:hypothetical protein
MANVLIELSGVQAMRDHVCADLFGGLDEGVWQYTAYAG